MFPQALSGTEPLFLASLKAVKDQKMLYQPVRDHYRCPEDFLTFDLAGKLSAEQGYFRFGRNAVCYGRSSSGTRVQEFNDSLYDVRADVVVENGYVNLPFNPTEVVNNLRLERYA